MPRQPDIRHRHREVFAYLLNNYFDGDPVLLAEKTGYKRRQARNWDSGKSTPRKPTLDYIMSCVFAPEFQIVCEFRPLDPDKPTLTQLKEHFGDHAEEPGIYAFYDSRAQLLYLGKATRLLSEAYSALTQRADDVKFPAGIRNRTVYRNELVSYYSAYHVPEVSFIDFPKHVESLILRISKPPLNKHIGHLSKVNRPS